MSNTVCIVGLGYMGLPMAAIIANKGIKVIGYDLNEKKVESINRGECPFDEKGMPEIVKCAVEENGMIAQNSLPKANTYIISVPTPVKNRKCDLTYVTQACEEISQICDNGSLVIIESTIRPNTCKNVVSKVFKEVNKEVLIAHCPERAIPGNTIHELTENDRIIGGLCEKSTQASYDLYKMFINGKIHLTDATTAECCKLMENTYRDVNIALANEFAEVLEDIDVNPWEAIGLANMHPRVNILSPGPGVGGHCIAIDPWFLTEGSDKAKMITIAREINDNRPFIIVDKVKELATSAGDKIGILGVAYKKDVDDCRETPATTIIKALGDSGFKVRCSDPYAINYEYELADQAEMINWADVLVIVTDHTVYQGLSFDKPVVDTRNIL